MLYNAAARKTQHSRVKVGFYCTTVPYNQTITMKCVAYFFPKKYTMVEKRRNATRRKYCMKAKFSSWAQFLVQFDSLNLRNSMLQLK